MFKGIMGKRLKNQSGMALPMALILMVVAAMIVVPGLWAVGSMTKVNQELETSTVGYYAAKAGIEDACWQFRNTQSSGFTLATPLALDINGMTVTVSRVSVDGTDPMIYIIQSTATVDEVEKAKIFAKIEVKPDIAAIPEYTIPGHWEGGTWVDGYWTPGTPGVSGYPFDYAIATTNGGLVLKSTAKISSIPEDGHGNIFVNGSITNSMTSGYVHGRANATGTISSCKNIQLGCYPGQSPVTFQSIDLTWYWAQARTGIAYSRTGWSAPADWPNTAMPPPYTGTRTLELSGASNVLGAPGNITYIDGNLRIMTSQTKVRVRGVVWVNGWIWSDGNCSFTADPVVPGGQCYLIARSPKTDDGDGTYSIIIDSNSQMNATGNLNLIATNGGVWLKGNMRDDLGNIAKMGVIYSPNSKIFIESNTYAEFGSIIGKSVELNSNILIKYNTTLQNNPIDGFQLNVTATDPVWVEGHYTDQTWVPEQIILSTPAVPGRVEITAYSGQ